MDSYTRFDGQAQEVLLEYLNFLDDSTEEKLYHSKADDLIKDGSSRMLISMNDIRNKLPKRAESLLTNFVEEIILFEKALNDFMCRFDAEFCKNRQFTIGLEGSFGDHHLNPRSLKSRFLGNLICCEGIVTKCTIVRPKVVKSVHYCPATKKTLERKYTDFTSYESFPSSNVYPKEDENKNPLETEYGLCLYKDHQTFSIQELPENAPPGRLPRSVDVIADEDLSDSCKPGDRVRVVGLYRCLPNKQNGFSTGSFRTVLIANNVQLMSKEMQPTFLASDIRNIRRLSRTKGVLNLLARSLAPSIWGHNEVKKAILCLLLGGTEKILGNGSRLRGDINILLIGDPSVAKSQLLRYVIHTAPRAIATTGRGSSGVGLTAAVTTDSDTGDRRLEAGAMVLADRGVVCIDEFDKMSDIDRTSIHEVMEQGRVTITKAGIHAKLNARCSVLAAANPALGRYNVYKSPMQNINMQDSLLSRFDLIFVLLDEHSAEQDKSVAKHILKLHRYRAPGQPDGAVLRMDAPAESLSTFDSIDDNAAVIEDIYEQNKNWCSSQPSDNVLTVKFLRKYLHMAKGLQPVLTEDASKYISNSYAELRSFDISKTDQERTMPVTVRQLETLIRLSTAMAKARFSKKVDLEDAKKAYHLLHYACFKEKPKERLDMENSKQYRGENRDGDDDSGVDSAVEAAETEEGRQRRSARLKRRLESMQETISTDVQEESEVLEAPSNTPAKVIRIDDTPTISADRYRAFRRYVRKAFDDVLDSFGLVDLKVIEELIQKEAGVLKFSRGELKAGFEGLCNDNVAMIVENQITLI